jgi:hypothetical protein
MRILGFSCHTLTSCAAAAMLAGCGGSQPPIGALGALSQSRAIATHAERGKSWMLPEAKAQDLLYVSRNSPGEISVYSYPKGKLMGNLTVAGAFGLCTDAKGDIFAISTENQVIYEYAHAGTEPFATLYDEGNSPNGCAVDPSSGNLAVAGGGLSNANFAIYQNAQGTPTVYKDGSAERFTFCTYDSNGNLFAGGSVLIELPNGSSSFVGIPVQGIHEFAAPGIQWDGSYIALQGIADSKKGPGTIYQIQVFGSTATVVNEVNLTDRINKNPYLGAQFWIGDGTIVNPESTNRNVGLWRYPQGGKAYHTVKASEKGGLIYAVTVSRAR